MRRVAALVSLGLWLSLALRASAEPPAKAPAKKPSASAPVAARLYSKGFTTWVYDKPNTGSKQLGYIRVGGSVAIKESSKVSGLGCGKGFYAVEPFGYVCLDRTATLTPGRYVRSMQQAQPTRAALPFQFALSNGAPMYRRLPSQSEWTKAENPLGKAGTFKPLSWGNKGHELLAEQRAIPARDPVPSFYQDGGSVGRQKPLGLVRRTIPLGSMLAYTKSFKHAGRTWLFSSDGTVVPADRVRPYRESKFEGVELGSKVSLPISWIRKKALKKFRRDADGKFVETGDSWPLRGYVQLLPELESAGDGKKKFLATRERGKDGSALYIAEDEATLVKPRDKLPFGVKPDEKYVIISITAGTLVAYVGLKPVFATLVSPGAGGVPIKGKDPVKMSTTPMGIYRVTFKHVAATMSPEKGENRSFWIADVPYTQYFNAPFALHVAYWHENFGEPMSAGCLNLSPRDGKRLFGWTEPRVPKDWNGAGPGGQMGKGTYIIVTR